MFVEPLRAARFHTVLLLSTIVAVGVLLTTVDPIMLTEYSIVFSAMALPLTYFPILVVANDRTYMGEHVNGRLANTLGTVYLFVVGWPPRDPADDSDESGAVTWPVT